MARMMAMAVGRCGTKAGVAALVSALLALPAHAQTTPAGPPPASTTVERPVAPPPPARSFEDMPVVVLQGLDKVTARTNTFTAKVGEAATFGKLTILVKACKKAPPIEPPESVAFLQVREQKPDEGVVSVFDGWMFSSSPALSAMEHPVYDVWVKDCRNADTKASSGTSD